MQKLSRPFKALWGPQKAELRRFKDGSILECAAWVRPQNPDREFESRKSPAVATQIVRHLLAQHFREEFGAAGGVDLVAGPAGFVANLPERGRRLWLAFQEFRTAICQLSSLPLTIKDVHPVDSAFSYTDTCPCVAPEAPDGDGVQRTLHDVVVEFEASGRWPDNAEAARKVAGALILQIREEMKTDLGIEADTTETFLDIRYPESVFRVRIFHPHELQTVAHRITNFQAQLGGEPPAEADVERLRQLWWRPRVRSAIHSHVLQRPALAGSIRLCIRWLASQMLSGYEELAEHLAAAAFLTPGALEAPTSPQVGFCRVLRLLVGGADWALAPVIVDFDGKLTDDDRLKMRQSFEHGRSENAGNSPTLWIASRFDPHARLLEVPPTTVSAWLHQRARLALDVCHRRLLGAGAGGVADWQQLFALDASVFDLLVRLTSPSEVGAGEKKLGPKAARRRAVVSQEAAALLVGKLRAHLSPVCIVFHDIGSRLIAIKWRPSAFMPQHQNVLMGSVPHTMIARQQKGRPPLCVPNVLCLTSLVASLSEGLALDVTVVSVRG